MTENKYILEAVCTGVLDGQCMIDEAEFNNIKAQAENSTKGQSCKLTVKDLDGNTLFVQPVY